MVQPIRILHIGLTSVPGGMESFVLNYYRHIDRTKFQFDFVDIYGEGLAYSEEIKSLGGQIFTLPNCKKHPFAYTKALHKLLKQSQYSIVHIHMLSAANPVAAVMACLCKKQVIIHSHNAAIPKGVLRYVLNTTNRHLLRLLPTKHWACGEKAGKWMFGKKFDTKNVITNAIDVEKFARNDEIRQQLRTKYGFASTDKIVGFVGRFCEQKNVLFLADILQALHQKSVDYKMLLVGDGKLRPALTNKLESLGLLPYVYFAGTQRDVAPWYQAMDYFVLPSLFEGLPIVGIEAQAAGVPCFFSDQISKEIAITSQAHFLPVTKGATLWAQALIQNIAKRNYQVSPIWYIKNSVKNLEKSYDILCSQEKCAKSIKTLPLISVIVPIYKVEKYLRQCLDSLVVQTYPNFEVILMDDGSPDNCPQICDEYVTKYSNFRVIHQSNSGLTTTRLNAIKVAHGALLAFVDGDDWVEPDYLSCLYESRTTCDADISVCTSFGIGGLCMFRRKPLQVGTAKALQIMCTDRFYGGYIWNKLYPREFWENLQLPPQNLFEDLCFNSQIFPKARKIVFTSKRLYHYRIIPGSMSHKKFDQKNLFLFALLKRVQTWLVENRCQKQSIALQNIQHWEWVHCMAHYRRIKQEDVTLAEQIQTYRPQIKWYFQMDRYFFYRWGHLGYLVLNNIVSLAYKYGRKGLHLND